jgi:hypothetical protein
MGVGVDLDGSGKFLPIGMVTQASYDEDWGVQPANVVGYLGPISLDSHNYQCNVNIGLFVPEKKKTLYADGGQVTLDDLLPYRDTVQVDGLGRRFAGLVFFNKATQKPRSVFAESVVASNGENITPNAYMTANMRLMSIKRLQTPDSVQFVS